MIESQGFSSAIAVIVTALVDATWQPALIAGITAVALRVSRCTNATTRHAVWTLALIASVCVPVLSAAPLALPHSTVATTAPSAPIRHSDGRVTDVKTAPSVSAAALGTVGRAKITMAPSLAQITVALWAVIVLLVLGRLAFSFFYLERLKRDALPLSVDRRHALAGWDRAEKGQRDVRICVSDEIRVPVAIGIFDAMILLPHDLVEELDATDLDRILLHELAHVRRSDDWVNLFERIALAVYFFSPGMYWIARQIDLEREVACDDWVLAQAAENASYARCLARIVELTQWPYRPLAAPGVFVTRKSMSIRIERLLARGRDIRIRLAVIPSLISAVAIVAIVIAGGFLSPTIAYTMNEPLAVRANPPAPQTRFHNVVADEGYLDQLRDAGLKNLDADTVIGLKSVGVTRDYIDRMRNAGIGDVTPRELMELKSVGVTPEYVSTMRSAGLRASGARTWTMLKAMGVTAQYVSDLGNAGYPHLTSDEYSELKSLGVDGAYVRRLAQHGFSNLPVQKLVQFKAMGIDPK